MSQWSVRAQFLRGRRGSLFTLMRQPQTSVRGRCVMIVPPFAEEMNKSRRMLADVARGLAERGIASIVTDPYGTGDSEGEFRDADWQTWKADLRQSAEWSQSQGWPVTALLCVRLGCVLGADAAKTELTGVDRTVFWQPVGDVARYLNQFLRLHIAASIAGGVKPESVSELKDTLARGQPVEVAGYELSPRLARELERLSLAPLSGPHLGKLHWLEIMRDADEPMGAASAAVVADIRARGVGLRTHAITGDPFWIATEIVSCPALVENTVRLLAEDV